ncbi:hypothetical protein WICMUC_005579 [Wickerhamomyces mucosus]|uniref:Probable cytosolic iron-sulfur protein assembly protein 1 n=1 Tax=Wickerhamomyces mucosus TaxID=1378264 RepID=A0A9P8P7T1_9ASCO|nr:hypothetical protein WICMUC_005579 [Wickerhamomyces mucosus]
MTVEIQLIKNVPAHNDKVWSISIHKTLPLLATVSSDKVCKIFNLKTFELISDLDNTHKRSIRSVSWKPTNDFGPSLACGSFDSTISVWGTDDDEWSLLAVIEGHENEVKCVDWSSNGDLLASCSRDKSIWIWEADDHNEEFECISVLQEHTQDVKHVVWHPSLDLLASSSYDDSIRLWKEDDDDWLCAAELKGHKGTVWCSDFEASEEKLRLVSCSDDCTVKIWENQPDDYDENVWRLQSELPISHSRAIYSVSWSSNSGRIASVGSDGKLVIYEEVQSNIWNIIATKELSHGVYEVNTVKWFISEDKEFLITGGDDGSIKIWNV